MSASNLCGNKTLCKVTVILLLCFTKASYAQDTEPRRWAQIPTGVSFFGASYAYTSGDITFDPLLKIDEGTFELHTAALTYIRTMGVMGKSARFDFTLPYKAGRWEGLVDNQYARIRRTGPGDARMRFSMLLYGGPAETPQEFAKSKQSNTVVGAAIAVSTPTGMYNSGRLINLGDNRWVIRPQMGITHSRGKWTGEVTGSVFIYSDNNHFWNETQLETDPLWAAQAHLIYTFRPGLWASISTAYGWGGEATVNGDAKKNPSGNWLNALSFGFPINRTQGVKVFWLRARTQKPTGSDNDSLAIAYSVMF